MTYRVNGDGEIKQISIAKKNEGAAYAAYEKDIKNDIFRRYSVFNNTIYYSAANVIGDSTLTFVSNNYGFAFTDEVKKDDNTGSHKWPASTKTTATGRYVLASNDLSGYRYINFRIKSENPEGQALTWY